MLPLSGFARNLWVGVKAGVPLTKYFETGSAELQSFRAEYSAATRRYTAGISVDWHATRRTGLELDVLYHRMGYVAIVDRVADPAGSSATSGIDIKGNSWDFPLLFKYRFAARLTPFVSGGGVLRYVGPVRGRGEERLENVISGPVSRRALDTSDPSELSKRVFPGVTAGFGIELPAGRLRLVPEFRYTHWTSNLSAPGGLLRFAAGQGELLVGLLF